MAIVKPEKRERNLWISRRLGDFRVVAGVAAVIAAALVLAEYVPALRADRSLQRAVSSGIIRVGYSLEAPYAFFTPEGQLTGVSPEIVRHVMGRLGVRDVRWRKSEFGDLLNELEAGHIDMIAAGMFVTSGRLQRVSFSHPVFTDPPSLLVVQGNPKNISHYRQIVDDPSIRLAVILGSIEEQVYRGIGVDPARVLAIPDIPTIRAAIAGGVADAIALPSSSVRRMAADDRFGRAEVNKDYVHPPDALPDISAFACRKKDRALLRAINRELAAFIGTEEQVSLISSFGLTRSNVPLPSSKR